MKTIRLALLSIVAAGALGFPSQAQQAKAGPAAAPTDLPIAEWTAHAARTAAEFQARAAFWLKVAAILNGPRVEIPARVQEARSVLQEELDLAAAQFEARLRVSGELGGGAYDPRIDPSEFSSTVTNLYLPLVPGRTLVYEKQTPDGLERKEVTTLEATAEIGGVECRAVTELETLDGRLVELSVNWFAQHLSGAVWCFGEAAMQYDSGIPDSLEGSWRFGKDGAKPGIVMLGSPEPGAVYREEYCVNVSEDVVRVLSVDASVSVPAGGFRNCVQTEDSTALEPDDLDNKVYAPGVGVVVEIDMVTGARLELVEIVN